MFESVRAPISHPARQASSRTDGRYWRAKFLCAATVVLCMASVSTARAQAPAGKPDELPKPKNIELKTRDGVQLAATYYGSNLGKEAAPIVLLHEYKGSRADFQDLAASLQKAGYAVLVPDLRGHGHSKRQTLPNGREREIDAGLLNRNDLERMITHDVEACKTFLFERNNAGELNIDKLGVVGAEMGAVVAANWAAWDWHWPMLATGKQGQDVKAVVLISPTWAFKGLNLAKTLNDRDFVRQLSWLVVVGEQQHSEAREAKRIHQVLERVHPAPPPAEAAEKQMLYLISLPTTLQGTKLLGVPNFQMPGSIANFFNRRLVNQLHAWNDRSRP